MAKNVPPPDDKMLPPFLLGDDKRTAVLRAAHKLFLRDGYSATSMDAVTQVAGVSKATVYAHFEGKDRLFEALIRQGSETALSRTPPLARAGGDPAAELLAFFEPFLELLFSGGHAWDRLVISEAQRHPEIAAFFYRCTIERITTSVEGYLEALADEGRYADDAKRGAFALVSMALLGPLHNALIVGSAAVDARAAVRFGVELLLRPPPEAP